MTTGSSSPRIVVGPHGGDGDRLAAALGIDRADVLDLSMSLNPLAPSVASMVAPHLDRLGVYPDPTEARAVAAEVFGRTPSEVLLTNGGAEAIALVASDMGEGWVDEPDFSLYRRHLRALRPDGPRWRSDPHSPSGRLAGPDEVASVWDEAFYPIATGRWTADRREAITVGSFTKVFACPGLRMGYVLSADTDLIARLEARQPRWAVSSLALAVLPDLLAEAPLVQWRDGVAELRRKLVALLEARGFSVEAGVANWVLVTDAGDLRHQLGAEAVAVRDCGSFGLDDTVRIAVPDEAGLIRLGAALDRIDR